MTAFPIRATEDIICAPCESQPVPNTLPWQVVVTLHIPNEHGTRGNRESLTCFKCGQLNHFKSECATWRTRLCTRWKAGNCTDPFCPFAHGESQLREPWKPVCVRVIRSEDGKIRTFGCGEFGHTYNRCPHSTRVPRR